MAQRINRILSLSGIASRRKADELIESGRIMLNGRIVRELGTKAQWGKDSIKQDGNEIPKPSSRTYIILNKPFGYISSLHDPQKRPVVTDLLKDITQRVYPVGRLDFDSLGLLILTNDGDLAHRLTHPRHHVPRTYKVTVKGTLHEETLHRLRKGVQLEDGFSGPSRASIVKQSGGNSVIRLTISQGRNRMVRRMMEAVGHRAIHLIRTGFGDLELKDLKIGRYRHLTSHEVISLKKSVGLSSD
jgi:pseudouridine synthase